MKNLHSFCQKSFLILFTSALAPQLRADLLNIGPRLVERNELNRLTQNPEYKAYLFDHKVQSRISKQLVAEEIREYVIDCQSNLRPFIQSEKVLAPVCYLLRNDDREKRKLIFPLVKRYFLEVQLALREITEDPRFSPEEKTNANRILSSYVSMKDAEWQACFNDLFTYDYPKDFSYPVSRFQAPRRCFVEKFFHLTKNIAKEFPRHPGHLVSETGWIDSNSVRYLAKNDVSESIFQEIKSRIKLIPSLYPLAGRGSVSSFLSADPKTVFTEAEGFPKASEHFVWAQRSGIFHEILAGVDSAKETIFMDIFFLGGTMGAAMAKHLVELLEAKPALKILILRDQINHFGHEPNMLPIFNFLLAYSIKHPTRLVILPSSIKHHLSGLPGFLSPLMTDELLKDTGLQKHLDLYGRAMSDHSKVLVIDGKTANPVAFVGSKNLTDESGGFCYDEVARVEGPAAAAVQDDYYLDMRVALDEFDFKAAPYNVRANTDYLQMLAQEGWAADSFRNGQGRAEMLANVLRPFDLLDRDASMLAQKSEVLVERKGKARVRTGYTNVDSTRSNLVDQVVQLINGAQFSILIKDQFLFDRNVVMALIEAKKRAKAEGRSLEIKAILEPLVAAKPAGMPNLLYLDRLKEQGIEVKWMVTHTFKPYVTGEIDRMRPEEVHELHEIAQEMHMKTISADGQFVIVGSANKDQTTMYGAFREEQLDIMDMAATAEHDRVFFEYWNNPELTKSFDKFDFPVPPAFKSIEGKPLNPQQFVVTLRNVLSILFDWTTIH